MAVKKNNKLSKIRNFLFSNKKRTVITVVLIIAIIIGLAQIFGKKGSTQKTYTVTSQTLSETISATGQVKAKNSVSLAFIAPSKVTWVGVKKGDYVNAWQGLASVDTRTLQKSLQQKLLDYMTTRWNFEQNQDDKDINGRPLDSVTLTDAEKRILEKSQFGLNRSVLDVEISDLAVKESTLVTPIAGTVVDTGDLTVWENLTAANIATKVIQVVDLNSLYFEAKIDETDYAKVKTGQLVNITLDAFPENTFAGKITYVGQQGVKTTGGVINILVDVALDKYSESLVPFLNGEAKITTAEKAGSLVIPKEYLINKNNKSYVQVVKNGKKSEAEVKTGYTNSTQTEIISGLQSGDIIISPNK